MWSRPACVVPFCLLCYLLEQLRPTVPRRPAEPELGCRCRLSPLLRVVDWYPSLPPEASVCASSTVNQTVEQCEAFKRSSSSQSSLRLHAAMRLVALLPFIFSFFFFGFLSQTDGGAVCRKTPDGANRTPAAAGLVWWCRPAKYSFSLCKINSAALALVERISISNIDHLFHQ